MIPRRAPATIAALALSAMAASAQAQDGGIRLRAAAGDSARIEGGSVLTTVFTVRNAGRDTARVQPALNVPKSWTIVMGGAPFAVAPGAIETWLVGVSVPGSAPAALYTLRAALESRGAVVSDSVSVRVIEHHALELLSLDVPGWVLAGSRYEARFLVRNRGNVEASVSFAGSTTRGTRVTTEPAISTLAPGASATVTVRIALSTGIARTTDDVIELSAQDQADGNARATSSAHTTVVPRGSASNIATVPAMLSLRSIGGASGVAPVAIAGGGLLQDEKTLLDFFLQSPTDHQSPYGFSERDEYRANLRNKDWTLKLGDNAYGFSPLSASGMMGIGAQFEGTRGALTAGAYADHLRWLPGSVSEEGVMIGTAPDPNRQLTATFVERESGSTAVSVGSLGGRVKLPGATIVQLEVASSDSAHANGMAERARINGAARGVAYEFGYLHGGTEFAGLAHGTTVEDGTLSSRLGKRLTLAASGSIRASDYATPLSGVPAQHFSTANVSASYDGIGSLEYGWLSRHDEGALTPVDGTQRGLRATTSLPVGPASFSVGYERGIVNAQMERSPRGYEVLSLSAQTRLWNAGSISVFGSHNQGATLMGASSGVANAGANLRLTLPLHLEIELGTSAQRATLGVFDGSGSWFSQSDARLTYKWVDGQTLSLRERIWQNPTMQGSADARAIYLEYRTPIHLPIGLARAGGRAEGRITDLATGQPLVGALVRIADQAAVTDKDGRVSFRDLAAARHRVSVDPTGAAAGAMLVGDAFVDTRDTHRSGPATFALAAARGGSLHVTVRVFETPLGTTEANKDSLVAVGNQSDVLIALVGGRDTVYQASDDKGRVDFGAVPPGTYTLIVMPGPLPDRHVIATDRIEVTIKPGVRNDVEFRVVPQRRTVIFLPGDVTLIAKPQTPPTPKKND